LLANDAVIFAEVEGNTTVADDVSVKLKHFSAQVAMVAQSSHGFAL
jgi:hypothetical protein